MELSNFFRQHVSVSSEMEDILNHIFVREEFPKGHHLLYPDNHSTHFFL